MQTFVNVRSCRVLLFLVGFQAFAAPTIYDRVFGGDKLNGEPIVNSDYVAKLVKSKKVRSVEDLLKKLPKHYRSAFVLIHTSESLQQADYLNPRVLLVGKEDFLGDPKNKKHEAILSFNGDPSQFGYDRVEMLQYQPKSRKFELSEITFENGHASLSETNPSRCLKCHARGSDEPYPIFHLYPRWPGSYGADDGHIKVGGLEDQSLRQFVATKPQHSRYKYLIGLNNIDYSLDKQHYLSSKVGLNLPDDFARKGGYWISTYIGGGLDVLSQRLNEDNTNRIIRQIENSPKFGKSKDLLSCLSTFLDGKYTWDKLRTAAEFSTPHAYFESAFLSTDKQFWDVYEQTQQDTGFVAEDLPPVEREKDILQKDRVTPITSVLAWITQTSLDLDPTKWSIRPHSRDLSLLQPHDTDGLLAITRAFQPTTPPSTEECFMRFKQQNESIPDALALQYGQNWNDKMFPTAEPVPVPQVALLCASCHSGMTNHNFPFSDPLNLKKILTAEFMNKVLYRLSSQAHDVGDSMPYKEPMLSDRNQKILLDYLQSVQNLQ